MEPHEWGLVALASIAVYLGVCVVIALILKRFSH